jgi:hypothetical protein
VDNRAAWSAAGGIVTVVSAPNAVAWGVAAANSSTPLPAWPAYVFAVLALAGLYLACAPLARVWPFHRLSLAPAELLDDCIRQGIDARERIVREDLNELETTRVAAAWMFLTADHLHEGFPAIVDEYILASGDADSFSGRERGSAASLVRRPFPGVSLLKEGE